MISDKSLSRLQKRLRRHAHASGRKPVVSTVAQFTQKRGQDFWDIPDKDVTLKISLTALPIDATQFSATDPQNFEAWKKELSQALRDEFLEFNLDIEFTFAELDHLIEFKPWVVEELTTSDLKDIQAEMIELVEEAAEEVSQQILYPEEIESEDITL